MSKTVIGFFNTAYDAQVAMERLTEKGISRQSIDLSQGQRPEHDVHKPNKVTEFFNRLFGNDSDDARKYAHVGNDQVTILTVHAMDKEEAENAADLMDDCGAIDVDERHGAFASHSTDTMHTQTKGDSDSVHGTRGFASQQQQQYVSGREERSTDAHRFKGAGSIDQDRQNLSTGHNYTASAAPDSNSAEDYPASRQGPGSSGSNSEYIDERSYPGDRFQGTEDNDNDEPIRHRDIDSDKRHMDMGERRPTGASQDDYQAAGRSYTGEDMTNDGISSPNDDQRVIKQNEPGKSGLLSTIENTGLDTAIPSPEAQLERAKRRCRIIDRQIDEDYRLRD